jgi:hypothetical protein
MLEVLLKKNTHTMIWSLNVVFFYSFDLKKNLRPVIKIDFFVLFSKECATV